MTVIPGIRHQMIRSTNLMPSHNDPILYFTLRPNQWCQISQKQPTLSPMSCKQGYFKKQSSSLMQVLLMYAQFGYMCIFYLLLILLSCSTLLYVINVPHYHWHMFRNCARPTTILWPQLKSCKKWQFFFQKWNKVFSSSEDLTFMLKGEYINFSTWFMKSVLLKQTIIKSRNKCHFVEDKSDTQHVLQMQYISYLPKYKNIFLSVLFNMRSRM